LTIIFLFSQTTRHSNIILALTLSNGRCCHLSNSPPTANWPYLILDWWKRT